MKKVLFTFLTLVSLVGMAQETEAAQTASSSPTTANAVEQSKDLSLPEGQLKEQIEQEQAEAEERGDVGLSQEAVDAVAEAEAALTALKENDTETALSALERATGKLEILVAREPDLALAPVLVDTEVIDSGIVTAQEAEQIRKEAQRALNDNDALTARMLLERLASEIRVRTTHMPLVSYPGAMIEAAALIGRGDTEAAIATLETALTTFVVTEYFLPLPTITAQALLDEAENAVDEDRLEDADILLAEARNELKLARALGYADESYDALDDELIELQRLVKAKEPSESAFTRFRESVAQLFNRQSSER